MENELGLKSPLMPKLHLHPVFEVSAMLYRQEIVEEMGINAQQMKGRAVRNDSLLKVVTSSSSQIVPFNSEVPYGLY